MFFFKFIAHQQLPLVQQLGTVLRLLSAYKVVLPSLYNAGRAMDLWMLMDGVRRAVLVDSSDGSSSPSLAVSELKLDLLRLIAATGIPAKQLLKTVSFIFLCPFVSSLQFFDVLWKKWKMKWSTAIKVILSLTNCCSGTVQPRKWQLTCIDCSTVAQVSGSP